MVAQSLAHLKNIKNVKFSSIIIYLRNSPYYNKFDRNFLIGIYRPIPFSNSENYGEFNDALFFQIRVGDRKKDVLANA